MINCVVFDLDGTLVKSHETIYKSTVRTLEILGLSSSIDKPRFFGLLGHHFKDIFDECNIAVPDVEFFISNYKRIYFDYIGESQLYGNAISVLMELKRRGDMFNFINMRFYCVNAYTKFICNHIIGISKR